MAVDPDSYRAIFEMIQLPALLVVGQEKIRMITKDAYQHLQLDPKQNIYDMGRLRSMCCDENLLPGQEATAEDKETKSGSFWRVFTPAPGETLWVGGLGDGVWQQQVMHSTRMVEDHMMALDVSSIVAITDAKGIITYANDTFCRISGYGRDELIGKTHALINSHHHPREFFQSLWKTIASGDVWKGDIKNKAKDGSFYWVATTIVPFLDERGRPYQYVAIRQDISEKVLVKEALELQRSHALYAEKMVSLGEMAAGIAHELGNPAASIQAWLDVMESHLMRGEVDMEQFIKTLPKVRADATRMKDIIRGMLTYARDGSKDPFMKESVAHILHLVQDYCSYKLRTLQIDFAFNSENQYIEVDCRLSQLTQVFVNLVINSCDAIKELQDRWIRINVKDRGSEVEIKVCDSGTSLDPMLQNKIFDPFFTTKPVGQGTGLGLSIVRSILQEHQGDLCVDPDSPTTCFLVRLPKSQGPTPQTSP